MQTTTTNNTVDRIKTIWSLQVRTLSAAKVVIKAAKEDDNSLVKQEKLGLFDGVPVFKAETLLASKGIVLAVAASDLWGHRMICVDDYFDKLSPNTKEFVLWHEVGHIRDTDPNTTGFMDGQIERRICQMKGEVARDEAFADDYAVMKLGIVRSVHALNELLAFSSSVRLFGRDRELNLRIERVVAKRAQENKTRLSEYK